MDLATQQNKKISEKYPLQIEDMQGLIVRGYKTLTAATYIMLKITNVKEAKAYFKTLLEKVTTGKADKHKTNHDPVSAVNIAFTGSGIGLMLNTETLKTFSREFREGMIARQNAYGEAAAEKPQPEERGILLGDQGDNHPNNWNWGNEQKPVDVMLMVYAKDKTALDALINEIYCQKRKGVETVYVAGTWEYDPNNLKEHFGFMDGISQPIIEGLGTKKTADKSTRIQPGEFILGYRNEYNNCSPCPYVDANAAALLKKQPVENLGMNGTYLVFRQMEQYVERFWNYLYEHSKETAASQTEKAIALGAKMVGRWPDGRPLVLAPLAACPVHSSKFNDFNYTDTDKHGVMCPLGSHIRRTNPRDQMHAGRNPKDSFRLSKKHRMLRRGRIYGEPLDKDFNIDNLIHKHAVMYKKENGPWNNTQPLPAPVTTCIGIENEKATRGLHFICLVSDISRQFEFVQNVWANTSTFADLCNEVDPIISPRPTPKQPECHEFTTPQQIVRNRYLKIPQFTRVVGGAYFFMPGITALKYIVT
jgi:Dyp-type peroxidase family